MKRNSDIRYISVTLQKAKEWFAAGGALREIALAAFKREELCVIHITPLQDGFIIQGEGKKLKVSYAEGDCNLEDAMTFFKENNGGDESVENLRFLAKHRNTINEELAKLHKVSIGGWYWTSEISMENNGCAFIVNAKNGQVNTACYIHNYARAIKDLYPNAYLSN